jgi:hypothetical protein
VAVAVRHRHDLPDLPWFPDWSAPAGRRTTFALAPTPLAWQAELSAMAIDPGLSITDLDEAFATPAAFQRRLGECGGSSPRLAS